MNPRIEGIFGRARGTGSFLRCRAQMEMDTLVRSAGFEKLETRMDGNGIFSVSLARRRL